MAKIDGYYEIGNVFIRKLEVETSFLTEYSLFCTKC